MNLKEFRKLPIIAILRGIKSDQVEPIAKASYNAGLRTLEITMNTPGANSLIKNMVKVSDGRLTIGAGTILALDDLKEALDAGATFIVMPTLEEKIMTYCVKKKIPVFPGALTPQEIFRAWQMGATMVKVFPAKFFGPAYFKEIKGPFSNVELLACGGVTSNNVKEFFSSGASGIAFGGSVFKKEWLENKDFKLIEESIKSIVESYKRS